MRSWSQGISAALGCVWARRQCSEFTGMFPCSKTLLCSALGNCFVQKCTGRMRCPRAKLSSHPRFVAFEMLWQGCSFATCRLSVRFTVWVGVYIILPSQTGAGMLLELHLLPLNVFCLCSSLCALRPPRKGSQTREVQLFAPVDEHLHCQPAGLTRVLQLDNLARGISTIIHLPMA